MRASQLALLLGVAALVASAAEKPRVFITDSKSWEISGGFVAGERGAAGATGGGGGAQTAGNMKTFGDRCAAGMVTNKQEGADYVVLCDHERAQGRAPRGHKVV